MTASNIKYTIAAAVGTPAEDERMPSMRMENDGSLCCLSKLTQMEACGVLDGWFTDVPYEPRLCYFYFLATPAEAPAEAAASARFRSTSDAVGSRPILSQAGCRDYRVCLAVSLQVTQVNSTCSRQHFLKMCNWFQFPNAKDTHFQA